MIERTTPEPPEMEAEDSGEQASTTDIPMSLIGDQQVNPGDVIRLEVVSANAENGTITVTYAHDDKQVSAKGSDDLAADMES